MYDLATAPFWISLNMRQILFLFYQCEVSRSYNKISLSVSILSTSIDSRPTLSSLYYMMPMSVSCQIFQIKIKCMYSTFPGRRTLKNLRTLIFTRRQHNSAHSACNCERRIVFIEHNIGWIRWINKAIAFILYRRSKRDAVYLMANQ